MDFGINYPHSSIDTNHRKRREKQLKSFGKAFDSIHRGNMMKILSAYGITDQILNAIVKFNENTTARVLFSDGETDCKF